MLLSALAVAASMAMDVPCERITRPDNHWGQFQTSITFGSLSIRATEGLSDCTVTLDGVGHCTLVRPGTVVVVRDGEETWFSVPADKAAELHVDAQGVTCSVKPIVRTD